MKIAAHILRQLFFLAALCLVQVLVLNHIHLLGCATPLVYIYITLCSPLGYPKWATLLWSFAMGLAVDIFTNTPGVAAASLTLVGAVQPYFFALFVQREAPADTVPSVKAMGPGKLAFYVFVLTLLHCVALFSLEMFSMGDPARWGECVVGSTLITTLIIMAIEGVRKR